jgi:hypothetical protein
MKMDTQQIGIIGKHILIANLLAANLEVAEPIRDHGIDLIVYQDDADDGNFVACPIQLKTSSSSIFSLNKKYKHFPKLRIVYVWGAENPFDAQIFALTYQEAESVLVEMKYSESPTWQNKEIYTQTRPSPELKRVLERFRVKSPGEWPGVLGITESTIISSKEETLLR